MSVTKAMNWKSLGRNVSLAMAFALAMAPGAQSLMAATTDTVPTWHAQTLGQALLNMLVFALIGIAAAILGYKLFDKCTPGDLTKEIIEHRNVAAAIIGAAVILGVCIIIAASMLG